MTDREIRETNERIRLHGKATVFVCGRGRGGGKTDDLRKFKCLRCGEKTLGEAAYKEHQCKPAPKSPGPTSRR